MTLEELKSEAKKVLAIEPAEGFEHHTFTTGSGGRPRNKAGVCEVHSSNDFAYDTVANGAAYKGSVTIECRLTGAKDKDGLEIYQTPDGKVFVYAYRRGSPESFDRGVIREPHLV